MRSHCLIFSLLVVSPIQCFHIAPVKKSRHVVGTSCWAKANRRVGRGGLRSKNKKSGDNKKKQSLHEKEFSNASKRSPVVLPSSKSRAPPWQVLSKKEADANVLVERERREAARQGETYVAPTQGRSKSLSKALLSSADRQLLNWRRFNPSVVAAGMQFIGMYLDKRLPPSIGVPEVAFLGRSNVGKSSLLNKLCTPALTGRLHGVSDEARVGKTPGATASVNLYAMLGLSKKKGEASPILGLVDLPGFGYAKLSKSVQESVQLAAERYLSNRKELALCILLVDARRVPSDDDRAVLAALYDLGLPIVVAATKVDKLSKNEINKSLETIQDRLGLPDGQPLCVSGVTGEGTRDLWRIILDACETKIEEVKDVLQRTSEGESEGPEETILLDDEGNLIPFDNGSDLAYEQGFDWIQDSSVMHNYEYDAAEHAEEEETGTDNTGPDPVSDPFNIKDLKKKAKRMERLGEV